MRGLLKKLNEITKVSMKCFKTINLILENFALILILR